MDGVCIPHTTQSVGATSQAWAPPQWAVDWLMPGRETLGGGLAAVLSLNDGSVSRDDRPGTPGTFGQGRQGGVGSLPWVGDRPHLGQLELFTISTGWL
jgi:hypothetical protein